MKLFKLLIINIFFIFTITPAAAADDCEKSNTCNDADILKRGYLKQQFYRALATGDVNKTQFYIENKIFDANEKLSDYDDTPLSIVAYHGGKNAVATAEYLVQKGGDVNHDLKGAARSPFLTAVWKKNNDVAIFLIKSGADLSVKSDRGYDACIFAHRWSNFEIMPHIPNCCERIKKIEADRILKEDKLRPADFLQICKN
ncbi:ankyrin repeat domain-containing protein [Diaphorobacter aerolatus]|uniref:Uncharacterized protein n=1 Tax=Diaphorobacter aerolatus TaxID=1288495 RepID=A0A7H0GMT0_9BURK|nr:ankyrin repeat domain-containing protein [Diaphorobacter aerolatus]QNP49596.1 hypothetical protein H9K75_06385 [Diaphorobacter aerolatus]